MQVKGEIFRRNQCTVLDKSWEHKAYCLLTIFILAGIKAEELAKGIWYEVPHHIKDS